MAASRFHDHRFQSQEQARNQGGARRAKHPLEIFSPLEESVGHHL